MKTGGQKEQEMLEIESRSVYGNINIVEHLPEYRDVNGNLVKPSRRHSTYISRQVFKPIYDVLQPVGNDPHQPKTRIVAKGFGSPEEALEWMEENRAEWDRDAWT